jgi:hypothetical protein
MKLIKNKIIPFGKYTAINLFGVIFYKNFINDVVVNHEQIHTEQARDLCKFLPLGYLLFYILYMLFFIFFKGYDNIPFEKEAYANQCDLNYCKTRNKYAWWEKYM